MSEIFVNRLRVEAPKGSLSEGAVSWGGRSTPARLRRSRASKAVRLTEGVISGRETPSIPAGKLPPSRLRRATSLKEGGFWSALFIICSFVQIPCVGSEIAPLSSKRRCREKKHKHLADRRSNLPRQRPAHAPEGTEAGWTGENPLPRTQAHLLSPGPPEWGRHQNSILHAGPLLRRLHSGHLRPRHHRNADQSSQHRQQLPLQCYPVIFPYGSRCGSKGVAKNKPPQKVQKPNKTPVKSSDFTEVLQ